MVEFTATDACVQPTAAIRQYTMSVSSYHHGDAGRKGVERAARTRRAADPAEIRSKTSASYQ